MQRSGDHQFRHAVWTVRPGTPGLRTRPRLPDAPSDSHRDQWPERAAGPFCERITSCQIRLAVSGSDRRTTKPSDRIRTALPGFEMVTPMPYVGPQPM